MSSPVLLPRNRSTWEAAVDATNAARYPLPVDLVRAVWNPDTCPVDMLGYLAWGLSVDVWDDAWPETQKRQACRNAFTLHRLKTTPAGIKAHLAMLGVGVTKVTRPPSRGFRRGALTEEGKLAWLDSLPQIRIYPFADKATARNRTFFKGPNGHHQWRGAGYNRADRARSLYGRRATFYDRNVETPITMLNFDGDGIEQVAVSSSVPHRYWAGHGHYGRGFLKAVDAASSIVTIAASDDSGLLAIPYGGEPTSVRPVRVAKGRIAPASRSFFGRTSRFLRSSVAPLMIYDRFSLIDPDRMAARRKVLSWHGHGRYGIAPYTAELRISVPMRRPKRLMGRFYGVGYRRAADMSLLDKAIQAVRVSKAFRDTVLIDTQNFETVQFADGLNFGDFTFGQIKEVN